MEHNLKRAVILGGGVSGQGAQKLAAHLGYQAEIVDDKNFSHLPQADIYIASPGVNPLKSNLYKEAMDSGVEFISEIAFGARNLSIPMLAITGTNGKTTTTELTTFLLNALGKKAVAAGNIGFPLSQVALQENNAEIVVVEVSSFQLELSLGFAPKAALLLNLESDHIDRYEGGFAEYCQVKQNIFQLVPEENCIYGLSFKEKVHRVVIKDNFLYVDGRYLLDVTSTKLSSPHNQENLAGAIELLLRVIDEKEIFSESLIQAIQNFKPGAHRIEVVARKNMITFINDSKATNPAAVKAAVESLPGKLVILLGGLDKQMDFSSLAGLANRFRTAIVYGESKDRIASVLSGLCPVVDAGKDFTLAFREAVKAAKPDDIVLLSPACASMDLFKNYEERGNRFRELAQELE